MDTIFRNKTKPWIRFTGLFIASCVIVAVFSGCVSTSVPLGKNPRDFPNTTWDCLDPNLTLKINSYGETDFIVNEAGIDCPEDLNVGFTYGSRMVVFSDGKVYFEGDAVFHKTKLVVKVTDDELFDGKYEGKKIVFYR